MVGTMVTEMEKSKQWSQVIQSVQKKIVGDCGNEGKSR